ncbi:hypothetical protein [Nocardiopsis metallicus]|uniref:Uncharacterized protein n=1 Tax=Nocardiopsis metallicus TaxID=179819 RepID=A0A840W2N9_9ACTN|nr:hypothetical protein [Nocardiopsis metallicus]MBB5491109.1 hypothetical protein [Nocardiopsis metallicus]
MISQHPVDNRRTLVYGYVMIGVAFVALLVLLAGLSGDTDTATGARGEGRRQGVFIGLLLACGALGPLFLFNALRAGPDERFQFCEGGLVHLRRHGQRQWPWEEVRGTWSSTDEKAKPGEAFRCTVYLADGGKVHLTQQVGDVRRLAALIRSRRPDRIPPRTVGPPWVWLTASLLCAMSAVAQIAYLVVAGSRADEARRQPDAGVQTLPLSDAGISLLAIGTLVYVILTFAFLGTMAGVLRVRRASG